MKSLNDYSFRELIELQNMVIRCKAYFPENSPKADFWTAELSKALSKPTQESHEASQRDISTNAYDQL